jgi:hypothetical protein
VQGRVYSQGFATGEVTITTPMDLFQLKPESAYQCPVEIVGLFLAPIGVADVGSAQEEWLRFRILRGHTSLGTGGFGGNGYAMKPRDIDPRTTTLLQRTVLASGGTPVILHEGAFNVRTGLQLWWKPGTEPSAREADTALIVRLVDAPNDSITLTGTLYFREM